MSLDTHSRGRLLASFDAAMGRPPTMLTYQQVADSLAVSTRTVEKLVARAELPASRVGGQIRIDLADLLAYIDANRVRESGWTPGTDDDRPPTTPDAPPRNLRRAG